MDDRRDVWFLGILLSEFQMDQLAISLVAFLSTMFDEILGSILHPSRLKKEEEQ